MTRDDAVRAVEPLKFRTEETPLTRAFLLFQLSRWIAIQMNSEGVKLKPYSVRASST